MYCSVVLRIENRGMQFLKVLSSCLRSNKELGAVRKVQPVQFKVRCRINIHNLRIVDGRSEKAESGFLCFSEESLHVPAYGLRVFFAIFWYYGLTLQNFRQVIIAPPLSDHQQVHIVYSCLQG